MIGDIYSKKKFGTHKIYEVEFSRTKTKGSLTGKNSGNRGFILIYGQTTILIPKCVVNVWDVVTCHYNF
jgi:hypothetical protein